MKQIMDFYKITEVVIDGITKGEEIEIYYSRTENKEEGWRKIVPKSISTDIPPNGEKLVVGKDRLSPGHILNAVDLDPENNGVKSFIIGKIKKARKLNKNG